MPPRGPILRPNSTVHLARPKTSPGFQQPSARRGNSIQAAISFEDKAIPEEDEEEEHFELLEYEWPDLPPIPSMKDAVSRKRVSQGISYLLPVDKGRNSINSRFRTDLRAMFQLSWLVNSDFTTQMDLINIAGKNSLPINLQLSKEPYASDDLQYDDTRVKLSAAVHFLSNTADTKWTPQHLNSIQAKLNADSENVRKLYVHSAPTGGVASRRMGIDPNKLRKRSNLFLPVKASKAQVSPEIVKLREEATKIIKQGLAYKEDDDDSLLGQTGAQNTMKSLQNTHDTNATNSNKENNANFNDNHKETHGLNNTASGNHVGDPKKALRGDVMLTTYGGSNLHDSMGTNVLNARLQNVNIQQETFNDYEELKHAVPPKPTIPRALCSPYLSDEENQRVWEWLHFGETLSDFEYFLSVCG